MAHKRVWGTKMTHVRLYRVLAAASALVFVGAVGGALPASAKKAPKPKLVYTPKKPLVNGTVVTVSGSGFTANDSLYVGQCVTADQSLTGGGCNINGFQPVTVSGTGTFSGVQVTLITGQIGVDPGTCGTTKQDAKACSLSAGNASGGDSKQVKIKFTIPKK
ncbi:MAG TPA: neocarzinostatin apoprotein domain-containing protein [Acidimicrobiales bacterium]|nr:neocarzinostatin apoprotein domain-containing protein [Acidimicrobiales bacterium]